MKHARELKVGVAIILAAALFFIGIRFFEDVPVFRGTYELYTEFENAQGLTSGNSVRVRGVNVGAVESVSIGDEGSGVRVQFHVDKQVRIPEGTTASISGIAALNGVRIDLNMGPSENPIIAPEGFVPSEPSTSAEDLTARAPELVEKLETVLDGAGLAFERVDRILASAEPELIGSLRDVRRVSASLDQTLAAQQDRLATTMENLESVSVALRSFTDENSDSLTLLVSRMNQSFARLSTNLESLESASSSLNELLAGIERGEGTTGRLLNDPSLYEKLDSTLDAMNRLLSDFQTDPGRYLEQMRLIDIF